jgi:uncharacterized membrane protein
VSWLDASIAHSNQSADGLNSVVAECQTKRHAEQLPFVPVATVPVAMVLALFCVGWLIYFIRLVDCVRP